MANIRSEKRLWEMGQSGPLLVLEQDRAVLSKQLHTETALARANKGLTTGSRHVNLYFVEVRDSVLKSRTARQNRPLLSVLSDRLSLAPVIMARRNDSNSSLSRNQLSKTDAPSRLRTNANVKKIRTKPSIRRIS